MAALNMTETENLRKVVSAIELVLRKGYDPKAKDETNKQIEKILKNSKSLIKTVVQIKGYHPK